MSHAILNDSNSIQNRDKLLKLAEIGTTSPTSSSNSKNSKKNKHFRKISNFSKNRSKSPNLDLSYTDNIEHLVINNHPSSNKGILNTNFEDDDELCLPKPPQDTSTIRNNSSISGGDKISSQKKSNLFHPKKSVLTTATNGFEPNPVLSSSIDNNNTIGIENGSRIPRIISINNNNLSPINNYNDNNNEKNSSFRPNLYAKYREFCKKNPVSYGNQTKPLLRMHSDLSSSMNSGVTVKSNNVTFIPIYNQSRVTNQLSIPHHHHHPHDHPTTKADTSTTPLTAASSHLSNNRCIQIDTSTGKVYDLESCCISSDKNHQDDNKISSSSSSSSPSSVSQKVDNQIDYNNQHRMLSNFINRINTYYIMDEDNDYTNTPKKIVINKINNNNNNNNNNNYLKNEKDSSSLSPEVVFKNQLENNDLLENLFLSEAQKNSVLSINGANDGKAQILATSQNTTPKSSSCDMLDQDVDRLNSIGKIKSENDLTINKNDLSGISHLEEETIETDSVINRFRKKFSIRGRSVQSPTKNSSSNEGSQTLSFEKFDDSDKSIVEQQKSKLSHINEGIDRTDINQNKIDLIDEEIAKYPHLYGKLSPRESRKYTVNRRSLRRISRRQARIRRSHTQPGQIDEFHEEFSDKLTDLSSFPRLEDQQFFDSSQSPTQDVSEEVLQNIIYAEAIFDYSGSDNEELSFRAGDLIEVTDTSHKQWWWGAIKTSSDETRYGWFPATYVRLKVSQEKTIEEFLENAEELNEMSNPQMRTSISKLSSDQVRANVVLEIINTERDFVKNLKDVIDGYLKPCRDRKDMFDETRISTIFGNIEELYQFQSQFLAQLEQCIDGTNLSQSRIGNCFLQNEKGFGVYCEFCKNHPLAISELQDLYIDHKYVIFFEGCRLLQNMIDISLDGFLLTPIQKICKYPLQLAELLKYTKSDHCDYAPVSEAYKCMQRVAQMVNERKSRFESLEKLLSLQESFENWEGPPLLDTSSLLIHSGDLLRVTRNSWSKELTLFLFDHLLILAKKDTRILKKRSYLFKTRINLDHIDPVISLDDNVKDIDFNVIAKNSFKFFYKLKQKWYMFQAKSPEEKNIWIKAFQEERQRTLEDEQQGFIVTEQDKKGARMAHQNNLKPRKPKSRKPYTKIKKPDTVIAEIPLGPLKGSLDRNRAGSLPSYIHQERHIISLYKNRQSTMLKKTNGGSRSTWFQLGSSKKNRIKRNNNNINSNQIIVTNSSATINNNNNIDANLK